MLQTCFYQFKLFVIEHCCYYYENGFKREIRLNKKKLAFVPIES